MHFIYVLYSIKDHKLYKGYTSNLENRLKKHNSGGSKSTAKRKPFVLIHVEQFENKADALKRERYLKTLEGGSELKRYLIDQLHVLNSEGRLNIM